MDNGSPGNLAGLFNPRSVAVVGASSTPHKWGNLLARGALYGQEFRSVYFVNSRGGYILDQPVFASLSELPEPPEMVVLCMPARDLEETVDEALALGTRYFVSITAGLGEKGIEGKERERVLVERIHQFGARLLGPNCMGVFDAETALHTTIRRFPAGSVGVISQSGNLCIELGNSRRAYPISADRSDPRWRARTTSVERRRGGRHRIRILAAGGPTSGDPGDGDEPGAGDTRLRGGARQSCRTTHARSPTRTLTRSEVATSHSRLSVSPFDARPHRPLG